jgi:hypothetical protein
MVCEVSRRPHPYLYTLAGILILSLVANGLVWKNRDKSLAFASLDNSPVQIRKSVALEEGNAQQAESLIRPAIIEFHDEKSERERLVD